MNSVLIYELEMKFSLTLTVSSLQPSAHLHSGLCSHRMVPLDQETQLSCEAIPVPHKLLDNKLNTLLSDRILEKGVL